MSLNTWWPLLVHLYLRIRHYKASVELVICEWIGQVHCDFHYRQQFLDFLNLFQNTHKLVKITENFKELCLWGCNYYFSSCLKLKQRHLKICINSPEVILVNIWSFFLLLWFALSGIWDSPLASPRMLFTVAGPVLATV